MRVKVLLFDFGGTLDANGLAWLDRFYPLYQAQGIRVRRDDFARAFYASDDALAARHRLSGLSLQETLDIQVRDVLGILAPMTLAGADAIVRRFLAESRESLRRSKTVLRRLRKTYRIGIVSNFYGNLESVLRSEGLFDLVDAVADSGAVGQLKPEPEIFRHALGALGAEPAEAWMVGDSLDRDMRGAERLGMPHAWLRGARPASAACCADASILASLDELEARLQAAAPVRVQP